MSAEQRQIGMGELSFGENTVHQFAKHPEMQFTPFGQRDYKVNPQRLPGVTVTQPSASGALIDHLAGNASLVEQRSPHEQYTGRLSTLDVALAVNPHINYLRRTLDSENQVIWQAVGSIRQADQILPYRLASATTPEEAIKALRAKSDDPFPQAFPRVQKVAEASLDSQDYGVRTALESSPLSVQDWLTAIGNDLSSLRYNANHNGTYPFEAHGGPQGRNIVIGGQTLEQALTKLWAHCHGVVIRGADKTHIYVTNGGFSIKHWPLQPNPDGFQPDEQKVPIVDALPTPTDIFSRGRNVYKMAGD